jgi:predicted ATPase/HPt (histidine-containing phosphotransfer) domain-containing protein
MASTINPSLGLAGYRLAERLHESPWALLFRGVREADGRGVLIKILRDESPTAIELARLRHEHAVLASLTAPGVARPLELVSAGNRLALVLEDAGAGSLRDIIDAGRPELPRFLELAIALAKIVESIHREGILHKDLKPEHFLVDAETGALTLIDFASATRLPRETPMVVSPGRQEGTLAYMSPEQSGRMNRVVDQRSDLYSLGVTLYELLTGVLPFTSTDPLELVHGHIARMPAPAHEQAPGTPAIVSAIVGKLLAKMAEDRYQSCAGLIADLGRCATELRAGGPLEPFPLGLHDVSGALRISQRLYGREAETAALLAAFERARSGAAELVLIAGPSGVGKSAVVHELQKRLVRQGRFVDGKFDQLNRAVPYASIANACRQLLRSILADSASALDRWAQRIRAALGPNVSVVADLVPELKLVLGDPPRAAELGPTESQNRFERVFQQFVKVFTSEEHPLVLFLDDLQWADAASLRLLQALVTAPDRGYLLVLGAYRDNEVGPLHALTLMIEEARRQNAIIRQASLAPLGLTHVRLLLSDALGRDDLQLAALAALVLRKTDGNPFFVTQFLGTLVDERLLTFAPESGWSWELEDIERAGVTDNVIDLLIGRLHRFSPATQEMLRVASSIGHRFDLDTLAAVSGRSTREVAEQLWQPLHDGLLVPLDDRYRYGADAEPGAPGEPAPINARYRFLHDRVQQAAYALIEPADRAAVHLRVGRWLLERGERSSQEDLLFEVVGHLNRGAVGITDPAERLRLATLNLTAGCRARDSAAYETGIALLGQSIALLGRQGWSTGYEPTLAAHLALAECEAANGAPATAFELIETIDRQARPGLDRSAARRLKGQLLTQMNRMPEAVAAIAEAAAMLGIVLPLDPEVLGPAIGGEFGALARALAGREIESLADLPLMTDPRALATVEVLRAAIPSAFTCNQGLLALVILKAISLSLEHGNPPAASHLYCMYGLLHGSITGDRATGYRFGVLGVRLGERPAHRSSAGGAEFVFAAMVAHWHAHVSESLEHFHRATRASLEAGDRIHLGYAIATASMMRLCVGEGLDALRDDVPGYAEALRTGGDRANLNAVLSVAQSVANLQGRTTRRDSLDGDGFDERQHRDAIGVNLFLLGVHLVAKTIALFFAGDFSQALAACDEVETLIAFLQGHIMTVEHAFYRALARAALARVAPAAERGALLSALAKDEEVLRALAASAPMNHAHRVALVAAERATVTGAASEAFALYEQAIALAREHGFIHHEALANELCARFHLAHGRAKVARVYLFDALYGYRRWGATAKANDLLDAHPELLAEAIAPEAWRASGGATATTLLAGFDATAAMRIAQAIASELVLERLIERMMRSLIEHAGAQRGLLVVMRAGRLRVSATAQVDPDTVALALDQDLEQSRELSVAIVNYVARSHEAVVVAEATEDPRFAADPYFARARPRSVLCVPMLTQGRLMGVLYLENNAASNVFDPARLEFLRFFAAQAAIAFENATLYAELEAKVEERTRALAARNRDMRLVLDTVDEGLLTVSLAGKLAPEHSAVVDTWFGAPGARGEPGADDFLAYLRGIDPRHADALEVGLEALRDDFLPLDLLLAQLPTRLLHGAREYHCGYSPIMQAERLDGLLVVIKDITVELANARQEADDKERLALFNAVAKERPAFLVFVHEANEWMTSLGGQTLEVQKRVLHTLKGNARSYGLAMLARTCHLLEDGAAETDAALGEVELAPLRQRWAGLTSELRTLVGDRPRDLIELDRGEIESLAAELQRGVPAAYAGRRVAALAFEPAERALSRLGKHARAQASRRDERELLVEIDGGGVRLDARRWEGLWAEIVHLVQNSVDHGIEPAAVRAAAGKPTRPRLRLGARLEGAGSGGVGPDVLTVEIEDDGAGVDWDAVRVVAARAGLPHLSEGDLTAALFADGLTTRNEVSETAGRGVGLPALRRYIEDHGGSIALRSRRGAGACFSITFVLSELGPASGVEVASAPAVAPLAPGGEHALSDLTH